MLESSLLSYALRLLMDRTLSEDVVQEAFMKLHVQFELVADPRRWLYRTVHNLALNHRRQSAKIVPFTPGSEAGPGHEKEWVDPGLSPDEAMVRGEGIRLVRVTLGSLDERSREVLKLKFTDGLSYKAISEKTGLTSGHIGYLIHHAVKALGSELSKSGVVP